jgi:hypothetical protein
MGYVAYSDLYMLVLRTIPLITVAIPYPNRTDTFVIERKVINEFVIISAHCLTEYQH